MPPLGVVDEQRIQGAKRSVVDDDLQAFGAARVDEFLDPRVVVFLVTGGVLERRVVVIAERERFQLAIEGAGRHLADADKAIRARRGGRLRPGLRCVGLVPLEMGVRGPQSAVGEPLGTLSNAAVVPQFGQENSLGGLFDLANPGQEVVAGSEVVLPRKQKAVRPQGAAAENQRVFALLQVDRAEIPPLITALVGQTFHGSRRRHRSGCKVGFRACVDAELQVDIARRRAPHPDVVRTRLRDLEPIAERPRLVHADEHGAAAGRGFLEPGAESVVAVPGASVVIFGLEEDAVRQFDLGRGVCDGKAEQEEHRCGEQTGRSTVRTGVSPVVRCVHGLRFPCRRMVEVTVHGAAGDWSIFRPVDVFWCQERWPKTWTCPPLFRPVNDYMVEG